MKEVQAELNETQNKWQEKDSRDVSGRKNPAITCCL